MRQAIGTIGVGLGASLVLGSVANQTTSFLTRGEARARERWSAADNPHGVYPGIGVEETNADGISRLITAGASLGAGLTAGVALIARRPTCALGALSVSVGLAGSTLLTGFGAPAQRVQENLGDMGRAFSGWMRSTVHSSHPSVAAQLPKQPTAPEEDRPSAGQLRAAKLKLKPGTADRAEVDRQVDAAYNAIDFSKRDIVVWLPSTNEHYFPSAMKDGLKEAGLDGSAVLLDYPASFDFAPSVATGMEATRELLARIAERGGDHRVLLAGHSQGAWVIADAMADPTVHAMVDRALLFGSPGMAETHYTNRKDPKVVEVDDAGDVLGTPVQERDALLGELKSWFGGDLSSTLPLAGSAIRNPKIAAYLVAKSVDPERWMDDPHRYEQYMGDGAAWLVHENVAQDPAPQAQHPH